MEYLLVMALSGSTMTIAYYFLRRLMWDKISARTFYLMAKSAVLYYLIPLPFLKMWYKDVILRFLPKGGLEASQISLAWINYEVHAERRLYVNIFAELQMAAMIVWLVGACFLIGKRLTEYVRRVRRVAFYAEKKMTDRHRAVITDLKAQFGVKRRVALYWEQDGGHTMTFGIFKPVIICNKEPGSREAELMIRHEMVHIKRIDVFWKVLLQFAIFIHWWNPILWKLSRDFEYVCECSCDETAMAGRSREEVKAYLRLLVEEATERKDTKRGLLRWQAGFGDNAQKIKERVDNLMMGKKWNRLAAGALVAVLTFANSMTVFAYRDTVHVEVKENEPKEEIGRTLGVNKAEFVFDEAAGETVAGFEVLEETTELDEVLICYEKQFVDEAGNIYPVEEDEGVEPYHTHTFASGDYYEHTSYSNGGCEVRKYRGQKCTVCTYIIRGDLIATYNYVTCPH